MRWRVRADRRGGARGRGRAALLAVLALAACATAPVLTPDAQAVVGRVQAWLDGVHGLSARFLQVFPDGGTGEGTVAFDPPGRLRLDYAPGDARVLVANHGRIVFTDAATGSVTRMSAAASPFGLLLDGPVRLGGAVRVTDARTVPGGVQISLARADNPAAGLLTLRFAAGPSGPLTLVGVEGVDAEHRRTSLRLFDERTGVRFAPGRFEPPRPAA